MFDRLGDAAERLATNVSRRAFLGRLGQAALGTAGVLAGVLAFGRSARAGKPSPSPQYSGYCEVSATLFGAWYYTGKCVGLPCGKSGTSRVCSGNATYSAHVCMTNIGPLPCTFSRAE